MAGLENILEMIFARQQEAKSAVLLAAEKRVDSIMAEGNAAAQKEYDDYMKKARARLEQELVNARSSVDGEMKRRQLSYKVSAVDEVIEQTLKKLDSLPINEYFGILEKLLGCRIKSGDGVLFLGERDLKRIPDSFKKAVSELAEKSDGSVTISDTPADIENGFILAYGLISENCSFRDIIAAERDSVRDTAAKALFW